MARKPRKPSRTGNAALPELGRAISDLAKAAGPRAALYCVVSASAFHAMGQGANAICCVGLAVFLTILFEVRNSV
jgi:hypothetical protein